MSSISPSPHSPRSSRNSAAINVRLLFIPQADETATGQANGHSRIVAEWLAREGWNPAACALENGDYLPFDRHPNAAGYQKITQCVRLELSKLIDGR